MISYDILKKHNTTEERMREIFTRVRPQNYLELPEDQKAVIDRDLKERKYWEERIANQVYEQIQYNLQHCHAFSAVDLAFDCPPIAKEMVPLLLYAQDKLNHTQCLNAINKLENWEQYITKNEETNKVEINVPKFVEVNINLVHSLVTRRLSAQTTKYNSFSPYFYYAPKLTSQVGKLRGDALSQRVESIVDQFDYRGHNEQVQRDALLYGQVVDFVREPWIRRLQLRKSGTSLSGEETEAVPVKEGLDWQCPHPSHLLWDRSQSLSSIRKDMELDYIGYWDVQRYGSVCDNPDFYNRDQISYNDTFLGLFTTYSSYFSQYYCTINTGSLSARLQSSLSDNSRVENGMKYSQDTKDAPMMLTVYFAKIVPLEHGMGTYPYPIWVRFVAAGNGTIVNAKIFPSTPGAYCGINQRDSRMWGLSFAMQVMPFQDMLSNLMTQLMTELLARRIKLFGVDTDGMDQPVVDELKKYLKSESQFINPVVLTYSGAKKKDMNMERAYTKPVELCQPNNNPSDITSIIQSMIQVVSLAERINIMSSNEVGQPIVRGNGGVTATEAGNIEATTNITSAFVADAFDAYHADQKRILYESLIALGSPDIRVPVYNRYPVSVIQKAGFQVFDEDGDGIPDIDVPASRTIIGTKESLVYEYVFSTRDGAKRVVNSQTATTLIQLIPILQNEVIMQAIGKPKFYEIMNEIFRLSGAGVDLNLEVAPGDEAFDLPADRAADQLSKIVEGLMQTVEQNVQEIQQIKQLLQQLKQQPLRQ